MPMLPHSSCHNATFVVNSRGGYPYFMHEAAQQIERIAHGNWDREPFLPLGKLLGFAE